MEQVKNRERIVKVEVLMVQSPQTRVRGGKGFMLQPIELLQVHGCSDDEIS